MPRDDNCPVIYSLYAHYPDYSLHQKMKVDVLKASKFSTEQKNETRWVLDVEITYQIPRNLYRELQYSV